MTGLSAGEAETAARLLIAGRRGRTSVRGLPQVRTFDDAYAVQAAFRGLWGE